MGSNVYGEREAVCGQRTERNECCVFPFTYDGKPQHSCIVGGPSNFYWCATTANYDRDGQWDICIGIKCYICTSDVSWSDCKSQQQPHICPYRYDECLTLSKEEGSSNTSKLFQKRCTSNKLCTAYNPTCKGRDVIKCDFSCCMGDLCNKAACFTQNGNFGSLMLSTALFLIIYVLE
ncbi:uncharacterized protein [Montipora foliosa]|uniref:uncharacterized protein n=1 Tax=Montipora foliosa TaxID=591990 RepID=UPI0035F1DEA3